MTLRSKRSTVAHNGRDHEFRPMILSIKIIYVNFLEHNDIYFHIGLVTYLSLKSISVPLNTKNFNKTESIEILGAGLHNFLCYEGLRN